MEPTEHTMPSWDGVELFYRSWIPRAHTGKALLLFHRGHEHSGRWQETVDSLALEDVAIFAWDARGHGRSPGERGAANNFADVTRDADAFARHISERYDIALENMVVLAHSLAAVSVAAWVHDYRCDRLHQLFRRPGFAVCETRSRQVRAAVATGEGPRHSVSGLRRWRAAFTFLLYESVHDNDGI